MQATSLAPLHFSLFKYINAKSSPNLFHPVQWNVLYMKQSQTAFKKYLVNFTHFYGQLEQKNVKYQNFKYLCLSWISNSTLLANFKKLPCIVDMSLLDDFVGCAFVQALSRTRDFVHVEIFPFSQHSSLLLRS